MELYKQLLIILAVFVLMYCYSYRSMMYWLLLHQLNWQEKRFKRKKANLTFWEWLFYSSTWIKNEIPQYLRILNFLILFVNSGSFLACILLNFAAIPFATDGSIAIFIAKFDFTWWVAYNLPLLPNYRQGLKYDRLIPRHMRHHRNRK